ncbi:DNA polymerase III subunit gamma/tau [Poseidonibacter ostreae]|jgi:DNA polymerase III subunit gamma/tau|uniref:DNA polymerase III subunit gamma/tau n=1 Tax=Poseidonibacter ostreae TaxID=2654171 RepID=A0A6L4WSA2_9BACT|nr:DNA polymerase III subunit gamma/tau [Poseidonibacter ostreae]KAB7887530.1 DNA polymerase III subunit gamma/tau [Poseidonibacter ostreae]KAB7888411.1 DNA polymerase III subunit gamma/tau [Poseidonibacter ostreae]KAB7889132.1 DNA polymerase III subunit gamma/tau [Poseidonibacter ostreae]
MSELKQERKVLALKYRPHRFEDLVGQSTVSQTLSLALDSNRLSHAYLFSGLRGSGKTSTARIMAKALLCSNGPTSKPCEVCDNCVSSNANRHLDVIEMDAASNRGIDDIKDLIEHTKYKPSSARFKVFIIDEVHMLTTQAFNALLKTLEEPPGFVKFILATTDPLKLPATILSRTQHFRFNKISNTDVIHHLSHILNEENIEFDTDALEIVARSGQGSLRDTLTLLDQAIIFSRGRITTSTVVDMLGLIDPKVMDNVFSVVLNKGEIIPIIKELENYDVSQVCDEMTIYLKHKMIEKDAKFDLLLFDRFFRIISDAKHLLAINSDGGFVLILTLMKMIEATNIRTIDEIIAQVEDIKPKIENTSTIIKKPVEEKVIIKEETPFIESNITEEVMENIPETKIEEVTPADKILIETTSMVDLSVIDSIPEVSYPTPFDDLPTSRNEAITPKEEVNAEELVKPETDNSELKVEEIVEEQKEINISQEVEVIPIEEPQLEEKNEMYEQLTAKVYDRDYTLGECFENNFIFNGYEDNKLSIVSYAQGDDRKFLYKHFSLIRTFAQDVYGNDVELDFKKEEASTNITKTAKETQVEQKIEERVEEEVKEESNIEDTGSMIEEVEMSSGCVADMHKSSTPAPSQQELQLNDIINSPMLNKAKELFDIKKITVKSRS